ncbi:MAG: hypothetical protein WCJ33_02610 [Pseudomonadota bacterium]
MQTEANKLDLYKDCFSRLVIDESPFYKVMHIVEIISEAKTGLGEVIHDYADQSNRQLKEVINSGQNIVSGNYSQKDLDIIYNSSYTLKIVNNLLRITPFAMRRNHADSIGRKEKISLEDIEITANKFFESDDVNRLLQSIDSEEVVLP